MKKILLPLLCCLLVVIGSSRAGLDIVPTNSIWEVKDTSSGKTLGTFWNLNDESDYGFESLHAPTIFWSEDRQYLAANPSPSRDSEVCLYAVSGEALKPVDLPGLPADQQAKFDALGRLWAKGIEAVRWQTDGTLLVHFWAQTRATSDTKDPKKASVWAEVEINRDTAKIIRTSTKEPSASSARH